MTNLDALLHLTIHDYLLIIVLQCSPHVPCLPVPFLITFFRPSPFTVSFLGVSAVPEVFQYDLTALYADDITAETKTKDSKAVGTALNGEVHRDMVLLETGEVAVRCCILVATDGLFDMMSNDAAVDIAFNHWSDPAAAAEEMIVKTGRRNVK